MRRVWVGVGTHVFGVGVGASGSGYTHLRTERCGGEAGGNAFACGQIPPHHTQVRELCREQVGTSLPSSCTSVYGVHSAQALRLGMRHTIALVSDG